MATPTHSTTAGKGIPVLLYAGETLGQQGQGAAAAILLLPTGRRSTISQLLSSVSTTEAAYRALIIGLHKAQQLGINRIEVKGHNETVFNQINGLAPLNEPALRPLLKEAIVLLRQFDQATVEWISAEQNRPACKALQRCLTEALGRNNPSGNGGQRPLSPEILQLIKRGDQATPADFKALSQELDEFSLKSLNELRSLVPIGIQDIFALQWSGKEEELAQMYRWYLRGVPPNLAIKKVHLDAGTEDAAPTGEKLPWEGQLKGNQWEGGAYDTLNGESFIQGVGDEDEEALLFSPPAPPPLLTPLENIDLPLEEVFTLADPDPAASRDIPSAPFAPPPGGPQHNPPEGTLADAHDPFVTANDGLYEKRVLESKDTLPSVDRVQQIVGMILHLSSADQGRLVQELAQFPEVSNQFLTAIASQLKRP
ncbi:MAG: reverse transcriptase-like protein [Synechocystis sp.]